MTLQVAKENLCALQNEVVVATVLGSELLPPLLTTMPRLGGEDSSTVRGPTPPRWSEGGNGPPPTTTATATAVSAPSAPSSPFTTSGKLLLWHLHQHGQAAPWAEATEVWVGRVTQRLQEAVQRGTS